MKSSSLLPWSSFFVLGNKVWILLFAIRANFSSPGAVNFLPYIGTACMLAKLGNVLLWFFADPIYGVVYSVCCLCKSTFSTQNRILTPILLPVHLLLLPEPCYKGPENMTYLDEKGLEDAIHKDRNSAWLVELYAVWNPACIEFAPTFSELSAK